jgi:SAM-dependent methyltransferase
MSFYAKFSEYYEQAFPMREEVFGFLKSYVIQKNTPVLDLGCGPGHYCQRFQEEGFKASGMDLDEAMIKAARDRYPGIDFFCQDILMLQDQKEGFNLIYSIGNVMAHIPVQKLEQLLPVIYSKLVPEGLWIFQVVNWDYLLKFNHYDFPDKMLSSEGLCFQRRYEPLSKNQTMFHMRLSSKDKVIFDEAFELYPLTGDDYMATHHRYGFQLQGHYADFQKIPYYKDVNSGAVYVFRKPAA